MNRAWKPAPIFVLPKWVVHEFADQNLMLDGVPLSLSDTRNTDLMANLAKQASNAFMNHISAIKFQLECKSTGIVAVDIPPIFEDATTDAVIGSLVAISLSEAIMPSLPDRENQTPFSIFTASKDNSEKLEELGIHGLSPTDVLDFHSDGSITNGELSVPDYISIFNVFINYNDKGNFYWVPTSSIEGFSDIVEKVGLSTEHYFSLTPAVYDTGQPNVKIVDRRAKAAIFSLAHDGTIITFMNGTFEGSVESSVQPTNFVAELKHAISSNPVRYCITQESRRLVIFNSANGFHARDVFEQPMEGYPVTRTYLRIASISGSIVGQIIEG